MRATFMYGPGDVRVENVPGPSIVESTDAIVRITLACVCGSDLHPYHSMGKSDEGVPMGHEFLGVVEETGSQITGLKRGDFVVSPFAFADNTCPICRDGFHTACPHGSWYGAGGVGGAQAEAIRVPEADGTLVKIPPDADPALLPSLLALSDVYLTGYPPPTWAGSSPARP
ncbi:alcohol dehydrogenase catalytic domain-containing protein [Streptomyces sp. NPDC050448]|uniref:alcohol dehydrogenase catalytic domain-containing protein n=1 Tax=Streptomyces sp. NPDC050448 TaxID=3155404 RepID=UPI003429A494